MSAAIRESIAMTRESPRRHSRESENPVICVHGEPVEPSIVVFEESFDKLRINGFVYWIPAFAGMTSSPPEVSFKTVTTTVSLIHCAV